MHVRGAVAAAFCPIVAAACLAAACGRRSASVESRSLARPNILLVTIDTFRADRLGAGVAPALDRLAAAGLQFTAARSAVPLTLPSHTTVMTGLLPPVDGVHENGVDHLADRHPTIARLLKDAGYRTAAFVGAFVLDRQFGLAQGFDTYDDQIPRDPNAADRLEAERPASAVVDRALAWLERLNADQRPTATDHRLTTNPPFFVWIHLYDPHAPYNPPPEFRARTKSPYDGEIAYADAQIARVFYWLRAASLADRTVVIVAGDHGEGLGDHGERTHGMLLYDATLHVPLVVSAPGHAPGRRDDPVSLVDIAPTILHLANVARPDAMTGRDLLDDATRTRDAAERAHAPQPDVYAETDYPRVAGWAPLQALTDGRFKLIRAGAASEIYDVQHDPAEQHDLARAQPSMTAAMRARIDAIRAAGGAEQRSSSSISPEASARLRALGYVAGGAPREVSEGAPNPASQIAVWSGFEDALAELNAKRPDAVPALKRIAVTHPSAPIFQTMYARALEEAGRGPAALAVYRAAARKWPTDAALLHDLSVAARNAAQHAGGPSARALLDEAARAEQAALVVAPGSAASQNGLGLIAIDADRPRDAAAAFERAAARDPGNASYWTNLGNARRALHDAAGAEQAYRRALDVDARTADAANGLGVLLVEASRAADAVPWFERAVASAPDLVDARLNLGIALQQAGDTTRAAENYRAVLAARGGDSRQKQAAAHLLAALGASR